MWPTKGDTTNTNTAGEGLGKGVHEAKRRQVMQAYTGTAKQHAARK